MLTYVTKVIENDTQIALRVLNLLSVKVSTLARSLECIYILLIQKLTSCPNTLPTTCSGSLQIQHTSMRQFARTHRFSLTAHFTRNIPIFLFYYIDKLHLHCDRDRGAKSSFLLRQNVHIMAVVKDLYFSTAKLNNLLGDREPDADAVKELVLL